MLLKVFNQPYRLFKLMPKNKLGLLKFDCQSFGKRRLI